MTTKKKEESKKKHCKSKAMCKSDHTGLMKSLQCLNLKILVNEMQHDVVEHFADGNLGKFASELFKNDEPMLEIARHHRKIFVTLYMGSVSYLKICAWNSSDTGMHTVVLFFLRKIQTSRHRFEGIS